MCGAQERRILYGVDVTDSFSFHDPTVLRAVEFAAEAHKGQRRKTGEPYVSHCIETALIVENMLPPTQLEWWVGGTGVRVGAQETDCAVTPGMVGRGRGDAWSGGSWGTSLPPSPPL